MATTRSRFQAQETTVYRDLQATMRKLGATSLRVPRDLLAADKPEAEIVFDRGGVRYVVRCAKWARWLDNFRAAERTIYFLYNAIDAYGATTSETPLADAFRQFFGGFEALPDDTTLLLGDGSAPWWEVLGVRKEATRVDIVNAYRALAKTHHPDVGGNADDFRRLRRAYEAALASLAGRV